MSTTLPAAGPASRPFRGPVNPVVVGMTARAMLGRRRGLLLFLLPLVLLAVALLLRLTVGQDDAMTADLLTGFAITVLLPLIALIAGTGAIGPEIDDGSIVYLMSKPVPRSTLAVSKTLVAVAAAVVLGALPVALAGLIMSGGSKGLALGAGLGAAVSAVAYGALFVLLAVVSRHAVVIGLLYVMLWEGVLGGLISGAQTLSVSQWGVAVAAAVADPGTIDGKVSTGVALVLAAVVAVAAVWGSGRRLRSLTLTGEE